MVKLWSPIEGCGRLIAKDGERKGWVLPLIDDEGRTFKAPLYPFEGELSNRSERPCGTIHESRATQWICTDCAVREGFIW